MYEKTQHGSNQFGSSLICTSWLRALIVLRQQEVLCVCVCVGREFTEECGLIEELGVFETLTSDQCGKPVRPVRVDGEIVNIILMDLQLLGKIMWKEAVNLVIVKHFKMCCLFLFFLAAAATLSKNPYTAGN